MANIFERILGSEKAIEAIAKGSDKLIFTNQEKSENWLNTLKAYEPFKIAQRLIALLVTAIYLFVFIIAVGLLITHAVKTSDFKVISETLLDWNKETLRDGFTLILGFYFAGGMLNGAIQSARLRRKEKKDEKSV